jgi:SNF family Na+-dependent transporter
LQKRHHRLAYTGIATATVLAFGLLALNFPVFLDAYDQWGFQIRCGTGYLTDLTQAAASVGDRNFVDECETALLVRRMWTVPLAVIGAAVGLVVLVASATVSARESLMAHRENA